MRFDKAFADRAIALCKIEIAGLAACAVEFFGLFGRGRIALNFAMKRVFASFDHGRLGGDSKFVTKLGLWLDVTFNAAAISQRPIRTARWPLPRSPIYKCVHACS